MPASPRVASRYVTCLPCAVQRATADAVPYSMSSGCAATARQRSQSSGSAGSRSVIAVSLHGMDLSRLHPQARSAIQAQHRVPLTRENLAGVRQSMADAAPVEVGERRPGAHGRRRGRRRRAGALLRRRSGRRAGAALRARRRLGDGRPGHPRRPVPATRPPDRRAVLAVDYRLAPESRHPAALDDMERALDWLGRPAGSVAVAGDSAGGYLAAVLARRPHRKRSPRRC